MLTVKGTVQKEGEGKKSKYLSYQTKAQPAGRRITFETAKHNYSGHQAHTKIFLTRKINEPSWKTDKSGRAGMWTCMLDDTHLFSQSQAKIKISVRLVQESHVWTLCRTRSKSRTLNPWTTNDSGYSAVAYCSLIWQDAVDVYPVDIMNSPATQ